MTAASSDVIALCAALDAGDDSALLPLADALEEAQDARAAGLRRVADRRPAENLGSIWYWTSHEDSTDQRHHVSRHAMDAMRNAAGWELGATEATYLTRSAAYLALAEALAD